ncbi:MAG: hypothetical protein V4598_07810 [Bdellovibrionota bacterium]
MKILILIFCFTLNAFAEVSYQDCLDDAAMYAHHTNPVTPLPECAGIVDAEVGSLEKIVSTFKVYGKDHVLYLDTRNEHGVVINREILAGDQTELVEMKNVFIDLTSRRIYLIQLKNGKNEMMVFDLDFIGNVNPMNVMRHNTLFENVTSVKAEGDDQIEIINASGSYLINKDAESRTTRSNQKNLVVTAKE